ncbi:sodium:proton antiporter [Thermoleophilia bacterium SCSIO 60948]|nr:sodium:proton antiporter [Thermoleophilia bacterium SCSIO 60948]
MELLVLAGLLVIAAASVLEPRLGVAAPLLLVLTGIAISSLPFVPEVEVDPEWIIGGVLPPLLYATAVQMPATSFRREFRPIAGLSVLLVLASATLIGLFLNWVVPDLDLGFAIALGAIVSPTDAVATKIAKRAGVRPWVATVLEGESLLNDATALVLLRAAVAAAGASISVGGVIADFAVAVGIAAAIGLLVGNLNLAVRSRVSDPTVNTVISFTVPFLAAIPADELGASGLVAAVVAGLVTGYSGPRKLSPEHRMSDRVNWQTVEFVLEGGVFLVMGLEFYALFADVEASDDGIATAFALAAASLAIALFVRGVYVKALLGRLRRRAKRGEAMKPRLASFEERLDDPKKLAESRRGFGSGREPSPRRIERARTRIRRATSDIDYFLSQPLGDRDGTVIVWAGMRGAVTVAAAQTLPADTPDRSLLVLIAFLVATASLLVQGLSLPRVLAWARAGEGAPEEANREERSQIMALLERAAGDVTGAADVSDSERDALAALSGSGDRAATDDVKRTRIAVIRAQREAILDARDDGLLSAEAIEAVLATLDADEIGLQLKGRPVD